MDLGEAKKRALSLMAEYSLDGVLTPDGDNADYLNRMNRYASDAQIEICDKLPIESSFIFTQVGTNEEGYNRYDLPDDFKERRYVNRNDERFDDYRIQNKKLILKKSISGTFEFFYYKYPFELKADSPDSYQFEVDLKAQHIIPYFLGGMALFDENQGLSDKLLNMYYSKLESLKAHDEDFPNYIDPIYTI